MEEVSTGDIDNTNKGRSEYGSRRKSKSEGKSGWQTNAKRSRRKKSLFGLGVVAVGIWWLLKRMDIVFLPDWFMTWPVLLIAIGLANLVAHSFRNTGGYIMLLIGSFFLARNVLDFPIGVEQFFWPAMVIIIGLVILFKPRSSHHGKWKKKDWTAGQSIEDCDPETDSSEKLDSLVIFSGMNKEVISKNFQGGELTTMMGGANIHFDNAAIIGHFTLRVWTTIWSLELAHQRNTNSNNQSK